MTKLLKFLLVELMIYNVKSLVMKECNYKASSCYKVRETTCPDKWYEATDNLDGT